MTESVGWLRRGGGEVGGSTTWKRRSHVVDMLTKCGHRGGRRSEECLGVAAARRMRRRREAAQTHDR